MRCCDRAGWSAGTGHLRHAVTERRIHALAARCILRWAADPRIDAGRLRRALDDVLAADALTPPFSEAMKLDYLICMADLADMSRFEGTMRDFGRTLPLLGGRQSGVLDAFVPRTVRIPVQRFRLRASNDVERSRRAMRLLFANWLAQVDRPAGAAGSAGRPKADLDLC